VRDVGVTAASGRVVEDAAFVWGRRPCALEGGGWKAGLHGSRDPRLLHPAQEGAQGATGGGSLMSCTSAPRKRLRSKLVAGRNVRVLAQGNAGARVQRKSFRDRNSHMGALVDAGAR
jgi:hypothetical protein